MQLPAAAFIALAITYASSLGVPSKRIVNGKLVQEGEAPFSASLWFMKPVAFTKNTGLHHVCGGSLVAPQWILTNAQCFTEDVAPGLSDVDNWQVKLGKNNQRTTEPGEQTFSITKVFKSPLFVLSNYTGDVALVKLNASATMTNLVGTIPIDDDATCAVPGKTCTLYGWGQRAEEPYGYGSDDQYSAQLTIKSNEICSAAYSGMTVISDLEMCAQGDDQDGCAGDAGGPIVCECNGQKVLSGTSFYGNGCNRPKVPSVNTRLTKFAAWAAQTMQDN